MITWGRLMGRRILRIPTVRRRRATVGLVLYLLFFACQQAAANAQVVDLEVEQPSTARASAPAAASPAAIKPAATTPAAQSAARTLARVSGTRRTRRPESSSSVVSGTAPSTTAPKWDEQNARAQSEIQIRQQEASTAALNGKLERLNKRLEVEADVKRKLKDTDADRERMNWVLAGIFGSIIIFMLVTGFLFYRLSSVLAAKLPADRTLGPNEDPTTREIPLSRLPLGLPDGSIRAIISLFIVVVGFLVLALQKTLEVESAAAISGFIGAIISFYFATRNEAAARDNAAAANQAANQAASQANTALQEASKEVIKASTQTNQTRTDTLNAQLDRVLTSMTPDAGGRPAALSLLKLHGDLQNIRQLTSAVAAIPFGTGPVGGADDTIQRIDTMLTAIRPLLDAAADSPTVATVAGQAEALLRNVTHENPVVSTIVGALATVGKAAIDNNAVSQILMGLGGPVGLIGGLLFSGIELFADQHQFEAWKKAVLAQPFDVDALSISPDDPTLPEAAAALSPLVSIIGTAPDRIRELYRISLVAPGEMPRTADALAHDSATANTQLFQAFGSDERVLTDAINEYRTTIVSLIAASALPPQLPADPTSATPTLASSDLVRAVGTVRQEPGAAGALDQLVSVVEAIAKNTRGTDLAPLLSGAIAVAQHVLRDEPAGGQP